MKFSGSFDVSDRRSTKNNPETNLVALSGLFMLSMLLPMFLVVLLKLLLLLLLLMLLLQLML